MGRTPCCSKEEGLNKGAWTAMEDKILTDYIKTHGQGKWRNIPKKAGLNRCGKSCRLRWLNYLRPDIKRGNITDDEEELIIRLHKLLGNRWSLIAGRLPGRTDNEIKNYWNTIIGKKINNQPSPAPAPVRRSSSFCAPHDQPKPNIPTIKRSQSFAAYSQPTATADLHPSPSTLDHSKNYQNATVPPGPSSLLLNDEMNITNKIEAVTEEPSFSPATIPDDTKNILTPENFSMDFDMDKDFVSDILNAVEFSQLAINSNSDHHHHHHHQQSFTFDQQYHDLQTMGSFVGTDQLDWLQLE